MALVQGPGLAEAGMDAAMAGSPEESRGIVGSAVHEIYRHPIRNAIYTYAAMPWTIKNITSKGLKWPGMIGYRGLSGGTGWAPWATTPIRRAGAGIMAGVMNSFGATDAAAGFSEFGARGFAGLGQKYDSKIWKGISTFMAGGEAGHFGMFGYSWTGGPKDVFRKAWLTENGGRFYATGTAADASSAFGSEFLNMSTAVSGEWGTVGSAWKWATGGTAGRRTMVKQIARQAGTRTGLAASTFVKSAGGVGGFLNMNMVSHVASGAAYISLAADITKFAAKTTYKLVDAGISSANNMMQDIVNQEWGGKMSAAYITAGATSERQRALGEISRSSLNARSLLGNEAGLSARTYLGGRIV